ncbi:hypothetical protein WJX74_006280 [Apatococcus lobatus]|uniref:Uncharacterized protein n=1 Tax=Apatococcus lobatus TaxID=904363 RepID=A0AAW1QD51_9CHLO
MSTWDGEDRFSLLLLEDGEYYFRDYNCHLWPAGKERLAGYLKVCSMSLYFVPRDANAPIMRLPFNATTSLERSLDERSPSGEDMFQVNFSLRIDMKPGNRDLPYTRHKGAFSFRFALVYASLEDVLPRIAQLWEVAQDDSRNGRETAHQRIAEMIAVHEENERFNVGWLADDSERITLELVGSCITPLCSQAGRIAITHVHLYFQPFNVFSNAPVQAWDLSMIVAIMPRRYQLQELGLEIFFTGHGSLFLTFRSKSACSDCMRTLQGLPAVQLQKFRSSKKWTRDWVNGKVSNFDYLMHLNREAGRSLKDLTQYPVFPWVIADYHSKTLDLTDPSTFRDLSKPIGALNAKRLAEFRERFRELKKMADMSTARRTPGAPPPLEFPPFLYGCHYSTPGYVVYYLMRRNPELMLRLQNGRFDAPDRLFWSIQDTWKSVTTFPTDVKELIPEFYSTDPSFLTVSETADFGQRSSGARVGNVDLPPWATDAADFVGKLAEALESPPVSRALHKWIDLIFGFKNAGAAAEEANNVFHYLTYDHIALEQLDKEESLRIKEALRVQMMEFGRTPRQLFSKPHPKRKVHFDGRRGTCSCLAPSAPRHPKRPINILGPQQRPSSKNVSAVSRAVMKLTSSRATIRADTLAWLETMARTKEPDVLTLSSHTELMPLVRATADATGEAAAEMQLVLARATKALAVSSANRVLLLDASVLEQLLDLIASPSKSLSRHATQALVLLTTLNSKSTREEDHRLNALPPGPMAQLLQCSGDAGADVDHRAAAITAIEHLSFFQSNRATFVQQGALEALIKILQNASLAVDQPPRMNGAVRDRQGPATPSTKVLQVQGSDLSYSLSRPYEKHSMRTLAASALAALLQDPPHQSQAVNAGALVVLLQLAREGSPDLRAACLQCLAVLSKQDAFKRRLLDQGAVEVVCGAASASGEEQRPAAACLANLCSDPHLLSHIAANPATIPALTTLSQSPIKDVQRHAARAFWHLAFAEDSKPRLLEAQGLPAMLRLALPATYSTATQALSRQALRRLADDPQVKDQIFQESPLSAQEMENMLYNSELTPQGSSLHPSDSAGHLSLDRKASGGAYLGSQPGSSIPRNFSAATNPDEPSAARSGSGTIRSGGSTPVSPFARLARHVRSSSADSSKHGGQASETMQPVARSISGVDAGSAAAEPPHSASSGRRHSGKLFGRGRKRSAVGAMNDVPPQGGWGSGMKASPQGPEVLNGSRPLVGSTPQPLHSRVSPGKIHQRMGAASAAVAPAAAPAMSGLSGTGIHTPSQPSAAAEPIQQSSTGLRRAGPAVGTSSSLPQHSSSTWQSGHPLTSPAAAAPDVAINAPIAANNLQQGRLVQQPANIPTSVFTSAAAAGSSSSPANLRQDERMQMTAGLPTSAAAGPHGLQASLPLGPHSGQATPLASPSDSDSFQSVLSGPIPMDPTSVPMSNGNEAHSLHSLPLEPYRPDGFRQSSTNGSAGLMNADSAEPPSTWGLLSNGDVQFDSNAAGKPKPGRLGDHDEPAIVLVKIMCRDDMFHAAAAACWWHAPAQTCICTPQAEEGGTWSMTSPGAQQASQGLLTSQGSVSKLIAAYSQQPTWKASVPPEMRRTSSRVQQAILSAANPSLSIQHTTSAATSALPLSQSQPKYMSPSGPAQSKTMSGSYPLADSAQGRQHMPPLRTTPQQMSRAAASVPASSPLSAGSNKYSGADVVSERPRTPRPEDIMDSFGGLGPEPDPLSSHTLDSPVSRTSSDSPLDDASAKGSNIPQRVGHEQAGTNMAMSPHPGVLQTWAGALPSKPAVGDEERDLMQPAPMQNGTGPTAGSSLISTWPRSSNDAAAGAVPFEVRKVRKPPLPAGAPAARASAAARSSSRGGAQAAPAALQAAAAHPIHSSAGQEHTGNAGSVTPAGSPPDRLKGWQLNPKAQGSGHDGNGKCTWRGCPIILRALLYDAFCVELPPPDLRMACCYQLQLSSCRQFWLMLLRP